MALAGAGMGAVVATAALVLPETLLPANAAHAVLLLAPMVAGQALLDLLLAATRWGRAIRYEVIARSLFEPYAAAAAAIAAWYGGLGAWGLPLGYWCGTLAALAYALAGTRRSFGPLALANYRPGPLTRIFRSSLDNTAVDVLNALYTRVDLYLVGIVLGEAPAGIYGMAKQVAVPIRQVRQSFDGLLIPLVARTLAVRGSRQTGDALATATRLILAIQLPMLLAVLAVGAPVLALFGHGFEAGWWPLLLLASAEVIQAAFSIGDLIFVYLKPRLGLAITLASILIGVAAALLLIPRFGIAGGALSVFAAYTLRAIARGVALRTRFDVAVPHSHNAGPFVAAIAGAGAVLALQSLPWLALAAGLAAYATVLWLWVRVRGESLSLSGFSS